MTMKEEEERHNGKGEISGQTSGWHFSHGRRPAPAPTSQTPRKKWRKARGSVYFFSNWMSWCAPVGDPSVFLPSRSSIRSSTSHMKRLFLLIVGWTVAIGQPDRVSACLSGTFAGSLPRTVTWSSSPTSLEPWHQVVPFLFHPPSFLDRWAKADFALLEASLSLPCSIFQNQPDVVLLPEAWIEFLPALESGARRAAAGQPTGLSAPLHMCDLFAVSNVSQDIIPGCQDWSLLEAWKRLRIFYDIQLPISAPDAASAHQRQCSSDSGNTTWTIAVSPMMKRWMAERSPWIRPNATLPIVVVSRQSLVGRHHRPISVQAELHLTYWMDSKCL